MMSSVSPAGRTFAFLTGVLPHRASYPKGDLLETTHPGLVPDPVLEPRRNRRRVDPVKVRVGTRITQATFNFRTSLSCSTMRSKGSRAPLVRLYTIESIERLAMTWEVEVPA